MELNSLHSLSYIIKMSNSRTSYMRQTEHMMKGINACNTKTERE
jgi:hypothetical protein